jgi:hypothetical protein
MGNDAIECVSPILEGKKGLESLKVVCNALATVGATVNKSTGLHIHVGLKKITFEQYKNIFINYIYLEDVIDSFMAQSRRRNNNDYCKSVKSNANVFSIFVADSMPKVADVFGRGRYYKVNPVSYARHNTIEFRQHQGTIDFTKITRWANFIMKLIDFSKSTRLGADLNTIYEIPVLSKGEKQYFINRAAALQ